MDSLFKAIEEFPSDYYFGTDGKIVVYIEKCNGSNMFKFNILLPHGNTSTKNYGKTISYIGKPMDLEDIAYLFYSEAPGINTWK